MIVTQLKTGIVCVCIYRERFFLFVQKAMLVTYNKYHTLTKTNWTNAVYETGLTDKNVPKGINCKKNMCKTEMDLMWPDDGTMLQTFRIGWFNVENTNYWYISHLLFWSPFDLGLDAIITSHYKYSTNICCIGLHYLLWSWNGKFLKNHSILEI